MPLAVERSAIAGVRAAPGNLTWSYQEPRQPELPAYRELRSVGFSKSCKER